MKNKQLFNTFNKKKVIIFGNTGFKGTWLTIFLLKLGANIIGISDGIPTNPSFFKKSKVKDKITNIKLDIRNYFKLSQKLNKIKPDFIFHLAAQSLVFESIYDPRTTFETNILGTANILEIVKRFNHSCKIVIVTSDKCYLNKEINRAYTEEDELGGKDPYSASKASAEIIFSSYVNTFFKSNKKIKICTARAGNVIGGGDWSPNRLVPDLVRSIERKKKFIIRSPLSTRPWQHVLEPISGYIILAHNLNNNKSKINYESFNFAPNKFKNITVKKMIYEISKQWNVINPVYIKNKSHSIESKLLQLDSSKAKNKLGWQSVLNLDQTLSFTIDWYKNYFENPNSIYEFSLDQINKYLEIVNNKRLWKQI